MPLIDYTPLTLTLAELLLTFWFLKSQRLKVGMLILVNGEPDIQAQLSLHQDDLGQHAHAITSHTILTSKLNPEISFMWGSNSPTT